MRAASGVADVTPRETRTNYRIEESHPNAAPQARVLTQPRPKGEVAAAELAQPCRVRL